MKAGEWQSSYLHAKLAYQSAHQDAFEFSTSEDRDVFCQQCQSLIEYPLTTVQNATMPCLYNHAPQVTDFFRAHNKHNNIFLAVIELKAR